MTAINFDEPSEGHTNSSIKPALTITSGRTPGIRVTNSSGNQSAVVGISNTDPVITTTGKPAGVAGISNSGWIGVRGETNSNRDEDEVGAVVGISNDLAPGGWFKSKNGDGIKGISNAAIGVHGESSTTYGLYGHSIGFDGIKGETRAHLAAGVAGFNYTTKGYGIWGAGGEWAGFFDGNVAVTGDIMLMNADCAEDFDILEENVEPGTVMVLNKIGSLEPSYQEYDKKVAGIISGARGYKPAIVLDRQNQYESEENKYQERLPIALMGKVFCKVDARHSSIEIGDLLTTSSTKGCAMKVENPAKAFGAVIGKALAPMKKELGMIPVLVTLQ